MRFTTKVLPSRSGNIGIMLLNNPNALHALTLDMIHCFQDVLHEWYNDDTLKAIIIKSTSTSGEGKRPAFCAGGNVKAVYDAGLARNNSSMNTTTDALKNYSIEDDFFYQEYQVNYTIANSPSYIPFVSFWDGVVMGGGAGISLPGKYRIATENTLFAMPETSIGLFPDVGSMYWIPRLLLNNNRHGGSSSRSMANYITLTGSRLKADDLLYTGLATHYIPSNQLEEVELALIEASTTTSTSTSSTTTTTKDDNGNTTGLNGSSTNNNNNNGNEADDIVAKILMPYHQTIDTRNSFLAKHNDIIHSTFNETRVEDIVSNLQQQQQQQQESSTTTSFAKDTLQTLLKVSPTSLKITLEGLNKGEQQQDSMMTIGDNLIMEYRMARHCLRPNSDFYEGVRSVLIDKDHQPKWNPSTIQDVTDELVQEFFHPVDPEWSIPSTSSNSNSKL